MTRRLSIRSGARVDWVSTNAVNSFDLGGSTPVDLESVLHGPFDQQFDLWSAFITAEYELSPTVTATSGFGYAMRSPTMTELYAVGPFIAALPQFAFTTLFGNPNLKPERLRQVDVGLQADHGWLRGGVNSFYAWVDDYITYDYLSPPTGSLYGFVNTDRATLSGGEFFSEVDVTQRLTAFGTLSYVEGRDQTRAINRSPVCEDFFLSNLCDPDGPRSSSLISPAPTSEEPLPVIPPLQSRVGVIIHEPAENPLWSLELSARIVNADDRVATSLREQQTPGFATYDARGYWQAFDDLLLTGGVLNLTDRFYQEFFDSRLGLTVPVYQPGRSFYFGFELTY
jgi:outer membrane receptor protein involved in Fe transport